MTGWNDLLAHGLNLQHWPGSVILPLSVGVIAAVLKR